MRFAGVIALGAVLGIGGCSLFVSLDGLSDGANASSDASADSATDQSSPPDDAGGDASSSADGSIIFSDDFNRPDAALIGNAWIEKRVVAFALGGDEVVRGVVDSFDFPDNMVYRPATEDIRDSEISVEVIFQAAVAGYPQLHSRIQEDTIANAGNVDAYILYVPNSATAATLSRTRGAENVSDLTTINLSETMVTGDRYRLRLRVIGANPVSLFGIVEHLEGGTWTMIGEGTALDSDPAQLDDAGSVGFSSNANDTDRYHYDNFLRTPL